MKPLLALALLPLLASLQVVQPPAGQGPVVVVYGPGLEASTLTVDCHGVEVTIVVKESEGPLTVTVKNGDLEVLACALAQLTGMAPGVESHTMTTLPAYTTTATGSEETAEPTITGFSQGGESPSTTSPQAPVAGGVGDPARLAIVVAAGLLGGFAAVAWARR